VARLLNPDGTPNFDRVGLRSSFLGDAYHFLLTASWSRLLAVLASAYLGANALFAALYLAGGDTIENARSGSFGDAFFFSVQTMATIGFGHMAPRTAWADALVTVEAFVGLFGLTLVTGIVFAKFSRPTARVVFSDTAVVGRWEDGVALMFRLANARANAIVEAQVHVIFARDAPMAGGTSMRRFYDLALLRERTLLFSLSWTVVHPITAESPLYGLSLADLEKMRAEVVVSLMGLDDSFAQTVHARHVYDVEDLRWNARFVDIISDPADGGRRRVDFGRFHDVEPDPPA